MTEQNPFESKQRIIQEFVPGKQVTMAHLIANPNEDLYKKLGVVSKTRGALGILTITPSEAAIRSRCGDKGGRGGDRICRSFFRLPGRMRGCGGRGCGP